MVREAVCRNDRDKDMKIDLEQIIRALSNTVDLVGVDEIHHGKRVAYMTLVCTGIMGFAQDERNRIFRTGLLHDCGVSSTKVHRHLIDEVDWAEADQHCQIGAERLRRIPRLASMAEAVRYHHTRWQILKELPLPERTKIHANLIYLLDRVDALAALQQVPNRLAAKEEIRRKVLNFRHTYFHPQLVDIFLTASDSEAFWITMEPQHLEEFLRKRQSDPEEVVVDDESLRTVAALFAEIVDAKSPYTAEHSRGVASLSRYLAERCGVSSPVCEKIEVAGLLHDLGKLQVPDMILEFKGELKEEEQATMRHHSFVTYQILKKIGGLEDIALWAGNHHEKLDGSGYPFRRTAAELDRESRIIIVADIFQALAQNRPYRVSQSPATIVNILKKGADLGQLDYDLVNLVESDLPACYAMATPPG
jgi:putative nucleotidyltransferase with HDIG domain